MNKLTNPNLSVGEHEFLALHRSTSLKNQSDIKPFKKKSKVTKLKALDNSMYSLDNQSHDFNIMTTENRDIL